MDGKIREYLEGLYAKMGIESSEPEKRSVLEAIAQFIPTPFSNDKGTIARYVDSARLCLRLGITKI